MELWQPAFALPSASLRTTRAAPLPANIHSTSSSSVYQQPSPQRQQQTALAIGLAAVASVGATSAGSRRRRRTNALTARKASSAPLKVVEKAERAKILEAALLQLFQDEEPDILSVRECLARLAKLCPKPNAVIAGDWIIFWASREGAVDKIFGTGITVDNGWLVMMEFLLRFTDKKGGRICEGAEVLRKVGPFPNSYNTLRGTYTAQGTSGITITFDSVRDQADEKDVEVKDVEGVVQKNGEKVVELNIIYSSPQIIAMQWADESGECDFFVMTPCAVGMNTELNKLLGAERSRFFFN